MKKILQLVLLIGGSLTAMAQTGPNIPLTGSIGVPGSVATLGWASVVFPSDADATLTSNQWAVHFLKVTSSVSLTATRNLIAPLNVGQDFSVQNLTTGGQSICVGGSTGTCATVPNGATLIVNGDGVNYFSPSSTQFYQTMQSGGSSVTQRNFLNFDTSSFTLTDSSSPSRTIVTLATTGVIPTTYTCPNIVVDSFGRITAASNGTCSGGGGGGTVTQTAYTSITRPLNNVFTAASAMTVLVSACGGATNDLTAQDGPSSPTINLAVTDNPIGGTNCTAITFTVPQGWAYRVNSFLTWNSWVEWTGVGGGGGTPGGSAGAIQFNSTPSAGTFSGINGNGLVQANGSSAPTIISANTVVVNGGGLLSANNLSDVSNISTSRNNLGLGNMALQNASAVAITGGIIDGTIIGSISPAEATVYSLAITTLANGCMELTSGGVVISTGVGCGSGGSGITELTGDVLAGPGTGSQTSTVVKINGGAVPSSVLLASNGSLQPVAATATNVAALGILSNSTTGAAGSILPITCTSSCAFNATGVTGFTATLTVSFTSSTFTNGQPGVHYTFDFLQDGTGGRNCIYPVGTIDASPCYTVAGGRTTQTFYWNGTSLKADGPAQYN